MRKAFHSLLAATLLLTAYACSDYNIGQSITDTQITIVADSSFTATGVTVENKIFPARTITQLLGIITAENYGELRTDVVTQFMPTSLIDTVGVALEDLDSCKFLFDIPIGGYTGDSIVPMRATIYRLNQSLPSTIYSDFDPEDYYDPDDIIGQATYTASALMLNDSIQEELDDYECREFQVETPLDFAYEFYNKFYEDPDIFLSPVTFEEFFHGVYIKNTFGSGRVMNIYNTEFRVYYHRHVTDDDGNDSIVTDLYQSYLGATSEIISNNNISLKVDDNVLDMVAAGDLIVQAPCGYEVEIEFPIQEVVDMFLSGGENALAAINDLTFDLPAYAIANDYGIDPPEYLLMVKTSEKDDFFATNHVTDDESSFYATYDEDEECYSFSSMRDFVLDIINNKDGVADEEDKLFTLTPIDLISESAASSSSSSYYYYYYYYYYGYDLTSTTITGMRPALNKPCIAVLDLENAKIKLEYTTQTMREY